MTGQSNTTGYIMIHSDDYADVGKLYKVIEYFRREHESSAAELIIEHTGGQRERRVVPYYWIEWIPDGDW